MVAFYDISTGTHLRGLGVLTRILDIAKAHAAAHAIPLDSLVGWRLVDDMLPLSFQVHYACKMGVDFLKIGAHVAGNPEIAANDETTFAQLEEKIAWTKKLLEGVDPAVVNGQDEVLADVQDERFSTYTGLHYLMGVNLPNFYFHLVTAYDILRAKGVDLGKRDFLRPHLAPFGSPHGKS